MVHRREPFRCVQVLFCTFLSAQNIAMCSPHLEVVTGALGAARSLFPLLRRRSALDPLASAGERVDTLRGDIVFDNVHFNYPSRPDVKVPSALRSPPSGDVLRPPFVSS